MILAVDMGNTNIVIGCIDDKKIYFVERMATDVSKTDLEYAVSIKTLLELYKVKVSEIKGIVISSVVPPLSKVLKCACEKVIRKPVMIVGPGVKTGLNILMDNPAQVGSDLIVSAVAGIREYGAPLIILDLGTATTIVVVDKKGNYTGGAILPGMGTSLNGLVSNASQLFNISMDAPKRTIGKNTIECMKSGVVLGHASCIDGMIERMWDELGYETKVVATGGLAETVVTECRHDIIIDDALLLKGLYIVFERNQ